MINITLKDPETCTYYRIWVSIRWLKAHDNGAAISCGLTVGETVSRASLKALKSQGKATEIPLSP